MCDKRESEMIWNTEGPPPWQLLNGTQKLITMSITVRAKQSTMTEQTDGMQLSGEIKGLKWNMKRMIEMKEMFHMRH